MRVKSLFPFALTLLLCTSCNQKNGGFYDKVDREFGVTTNVTPYTVKDTKSISDTSYFAWHGRHYTNSKLNAEFFSWSNAGFEVTFTGTTLEACLYSTNADSDHDRPYLAVSIDNDYDPSKATPIQLTSSTHSNSDAKESGYFRHPHVVLAHDLENKEHTVRVYKRSEINNSKVALKSVSTDGSFSPVKAKELSLKMEFFGDSVTCGYAVESDDYFENFSTRTENSMKSFANYAANYLNADASLISCGGYPIYRSEYAKGNPKNIPDMFHNADNDWNTKTVIPWDNSRYIPDVVVIALGANDRSYLNTFEAGSEGWNAAIKSYEDKYVEFLDEIFKSYPSTQVVISDEILPLGDVYPKAMDRILSSYNASHTLEHPLLRMNFKAYLQAKNKTMPGAGHPNEEMQHLAGRELAKMLSEKLGYAFTDDKFGQS